MEMKECCGKPVAEEEAREVVRAVNHFNQEISCLEEVCEKLGVRLVPVMLEVDDVKGDIPEPSPDSACSLAGQVNKMNSRVAQIVRKLAEFESRVQL